MAVNRFRSATVKRKIPKYNNFSSRVNATGGTIVDSGGYRYHTFTASGDFTITNIPAGTTVEVLCIAGGQGGTSGGVSGLTAGGGAGAVCFSTFTELESDKYTVVIGAGGSSGSVGNPSLFQGRNIEVLAAAGGSSTGGSGPGGGYSAITSAVAADLVDGFNIGDTILRNKGGNGDTADGAGGGGGAGGVGEAGATDGADNGGDGGIGTDSYSTWATATSTGVNSRYAAGGGGRGDTVQGTGGDGGGGNAGSTTGSAATANTGSGGGGGSSTGGSGGSGILIVRYLH